MISYLLDRPRTIIHNRRMPRCHSSFVPGSPHGFCLAAVCFNIFLYLLDFAERLTVSTHSHYCSTYLLFFLSTQVLTHTSKRLSRLPSLSSVLQIAPDSQDPRDLQPKISSSSCSSRATKLLTRRKIERGPLRTCRVHRRHLH